ncbi:MAG: hypothetical protein IPK17_20385 [Chloroflexi bacterium]|uniref:hypothetical protein n=1 Tax=Candidatus Flexifilum breve TaxID=3140694 RepID=UPI003134E51C|nr:hypothetical protein [Chloroflexota bacterium]
MLTTPHVETRIEQPYLAIRTSVRLSEVGVATAKLTSEVLAWLATRQLEPAGSSFVRYRVVDMARELDLEIGVLVAAPGAGDERVVPGKSRPGATPPDLHRRRQWASRKRGAARLVRAAGAAGGSMAGGSRHGVRRAL